MADTLFDVEPLPGAEPKLSNDRRRTQRQAEHLAAGLHPLTCALGYQIKLHADAAPADDRDASGLRCGTCRFRQTINGHTRSYPKCSYGADKSGHWPRHSFGAGTDIRAWFPACSDYEDADAERKKPRKRSIVDVHLPEVVGSDV